ncbi:uncharacterized protein ACA1_092840 [Acanthamoeba castellanii str. Neff]|uniref:Uncharacterized protein n=1 Tax=Acanthamoeba castellanii (strain ATCC 30010 / Neff) TaxID=1257118 RepID=L8GI43_ACACF|nr:uncharacterized protein ACA1_092840 [Acanthamoeba castellanii str. Neff]ELR12750.1 hypothetical protein ACA1_092840 [Acanthamoeba castellanii str. Neff]
MATPLQVPCGCRNSLQSFGAAAAFTVAFVWTSQSVQVKRNAYFSNLKSEIDTLKKKNHDLEHEVELLKNPPEPKEAHTDFAADFESGNIDFEKILEQVASDH